MYLYVFFRFTYVVPASLASTQGPPSTPVTSNLSTSNSNLVHAFVTPGQTGTSIHTFVN